MASNNSGGLVIFHSLVMLCLAANKACGIIFLCIFSRKLMFKFSRANSGESTMLITVTGEKREKIPCHCQ